MMDKQTVYYTHHHLPADVADLCRTRLASCGVPVVSVSLGRPLDFGDVRITMDGEPGVLSMHRQILSGLQAASAPWVFLCEHDVLYSPSHFDFTPAQVDAVYYNANVWRVRWADKLAVWTDNLQQTSGICASRDLLLDFYTRRVEQIEREGNNRHYEPQERYGIRTENWMSREPNFCIRHKHNLTRSKWSPDEFRNPKYSKGWKTSLTLWKEMVK